MRRAPALVHISAAPPFADPQQLDLKTCSMDLGWHGSARRPLPRCSGENHGPKSVKTLKGTDASVKERDGITAGNSDITAKEQRKASLRNHVFQRPSLLDAHALAARIREPVGQPVVVGSWHDVRFLFYTK